ncbi:replication initiation and membrane attachment family protein [Bacillus methanolicus]|uniref:Replication initiation and membrane attachment protein n=1 Tax=Bacillus methanolicus (strain MGA3 / ATCC 53907) TaxID=796606 RepID=I3ECL7_BACMM|nr:replication initiation and membrane attachment family protein [Bacillus methanolicus]AIE60988.1 Replication initiation and membrane attachment protein [Bacillus methanolicus MGA3]EIJ84238.1 DNA replication protein DnaB [Bacillus methanolicus MGA3]UQD52975.1 Replication initiation and membrane attachment protein [Bacillus methanolicus]
MAQHWQEILPVDRYIVAASGLLHDYDRKVLTFLYQPLIGPVCFSLYMTLWAELEENRLWSESSSHHNLMTMMDMNLKEIYQARLKLEGIGLMKCYVRHDDDNREFIYELLPPLTPEQFFLDGMLNIYLYRKIGKNQFNRLKRFFSDQKIPEPTDYKEITKAFQDVFASAPPSAFQLNKEALNDIQPADGQVFIGRKEQEGIQIDESTFNFELLQAGLQESLVPKKALNKKVREAISNLAFLYGIDAIQMKNIVISAVTADNEIDIGELRKAARDWYQFEHNDELPSLVDRVQPVNYRSSNSEPKSKEEELIRYFETTSPRQLLKDLSGGAEASNADLKIIEEIMFNQKLLPGVVNVLVQYVMLKTDMKLTKGYIEKIASHWARKKIKTVKEAMELAKNEHKQYMEWAQGKKTAGSQSRKKPVRTEMLPDWFVQKQSAEQKNEEEDDFDFEAEKRKLEQELKKYK